MNRVLGTPERSHQVGPNGNWYVYCVRALIKASELIETIAGLFILNSIGYVKQVGYVSHQIIDTLGLEKALKIHPKTKTLYKNL